MTPGGILLPPVLQATVLLAPFASVSVWLLKERKMGMTLGRKIKECRKEKGMTQEALAEALFTNKSTISEYENDKIDIKISVLREIAGALDTPVSYLVASQETDIEDEMIQMVTALKQIKSCELRKAAIAQVKVLAGVM